MALPPHLTIGYNVLTETVIPSVTTATDTVQEVFQDIEDNVVEPTVSAILSLPSAAEGLISDSAHEVIPNWALAPGDIEDFVEGIMQMERGRREVTITEGDNLAQQITLIPGTNEPAFNRRTMWNMLATEGDMFSGETELEGSSDSIFAPFSLYFPTSMWPYADRDGSRYTVHDLGREPIESDFLGTKPIVEILMGRKLDKVGAVPGFAYWGDLALGIPPTIFWVGAALLVGLTSPTWAPPIGVAIGEISARIGYGAAKVGASTAKSLANTIPSER